MLFISADFVLSMCPLAANSVMDLNCLICVIICQVFVATFTAKVLSGKSHSYLLLAAPRHCSFTFAFGKYKLLTRSYKCTI